MLDDKTPFFVSYRRTEARPGNGGGTATRPDELVQQFHGKLCDDVAQLVALPRGQDMGFLDVEGMPGGTNWHPELLRALGSCQVMVALLSMPYLKSEWCGKEWHGFASRRRVLLKNTSSNQSSIVPIRWAAIPEGSDLPAAVTHHTNIFSPKSTKKNPDLSQRYSAVGLFGLLQQGEDDAASEIIWQLARLVQMIYYSQHLKPRHFKPDELIDAFREGSA